MQAAAQTVDDPAAVARIMGAVDELNVSIRQIRSTIFELNQRRSSEVSLRGDIVAVCDDAAITLGSAPRCDIEGPIDSSVIEPTRSHLLLCLREALSNVARHAQASAVHINIRVGGGRLASGSPTTASGITDTGRPSSGLDNMRVRAGALGGVFAIEPRATGGTLTTWDVPLRHLRASRGEVGTQGPTQRGVGGPS